MPVRIHGDGEIDGLTTFETTTLDAANVSNPSNTGDPNIALSDDGSVQMTGLQYPTAGPLSNRNLIINGAMQVSQRSTQVTNVTTPGYKTCDRFNLGYSSLGTWTVDQSTDAPDGFSNSFKLTCTTANPSPVADNNLFVSQRIEAQNLQHLKFGTSAAESLTLSFYVKSNKTGEASVNMYQPDASNRQISKSYTINSADTWEYKTITFSGDTLGAFDNNNGIGLHVEFWLNSGSDYTSGSLQTTWGALDQTSKNAANLGVGGGVSDYWQITGVQLEVGEKATPFENLPYGTELLLCQRYYETGTYSQTLPYANSGVSYSYTTSVQFKVTKRAVPTISGNSEQGTFSSGSASFTSVSLGRSNAVQNRSNSGTFIADAEL